VKVAILLLAAGLAGCAETWAVRRDAARLRAFLDGLPTCRPADITGAMNATATKAGASGRIRDELGPRRGCLR
jgi:hypothetical protein